MGLKFDAAAGSSRLLGKCTSFGPSFELGDADMIKEMRIGLRTAPRSRIIEEILFSTKDGLSIGFKGATLIEQSRCKEQDIIKTVENLQLVGIACSFDLGASYIGDHGIQPLYLPESGNTAAATFDVLYPSIPWRQPPPPHVQLRLIPGIKSGCNAFTSSLHLRH